MSVNKDKKTGKWYYSGKYKDITGKYHDYKKRGFDKKSDAKIAEEKFLSKIRGPLSRITLDSLVEMYADEYMAFNVKESTLVGDESYYYNHIKEVFGDKFVDEIASSDIEQFKVHMIHKPKLDRQGNAAGHYAAQTVNHALSVLSKYLTYAVKKGRLLYNPAISVKKYKDIEAIKKNSEEANFWEQSEYDEFLDHVDSTYWRDVFEFLYGTGVREGELFALTWDRIDLENDKVIIATNITSKTKSKGIKVTTVKNTHSDRSIDLQTYLHDMLKARYEVASKLDGFTSQYYVFGDINPLSRSTLARHLDRYIALAGVKRITPHGFRHSHASALIVAGVDDTLIAERLGHTVTELRKTYAHIYTKQRKDLKQTLDLLYGNNRKP